MWFHNFKGSIEDNLFIAVSQVKHLDFAMFSFLSLPGVEMRDVYLFLPPQHRNGIIVAFIGGTGVFAQDPKKADAPARLRTSVLSRAKRMFVIGIPARCNRPEISQKVSYFLAAKTNKWNFRGNSRRIVGTMFLYRDQVHFSDNA